MAKLLAPAGNLEKMRWAAAYGADEVYFGLKNFSLRSFAGNFSYEEAEAGLKELHAQNKKGYVTMNIYPFSEEYDDLIETAHKAEDIGADALIVADLGVFSMLKKSGIKIPFHISTQANTLSWQTVLAYKEMGASRVNLARELSADRIVEIEKNIKGKGVETEIFIHGSVCFSYSGRCAISDYMTGRRANRGECTHPCRWQYSVVEEKRPGQYYPVFEDERGLYLFNTKELALFPFVKRLANAGVASFKIEGRMKSIHYIASIVSFYRKIIDGWNPSEEDAFKLLNRIKNRGYSYGFMKGGITTDDYQINGEGSVSDAVFLGNITNETKDGFSILEVRNKIEAGDTVEMLTPSGAVKNVILPSPLVTTKGEQLETAHHQQFVLMSSEYKPFTIIRKVDD